MLGAPPPPLVVGPFCCRPAGPCHILSFRVVVCFLGRAAIRGRAWAAGFIVSCRCVFLGSAGTAGAGGCPSPIPPPARRPKPAEPALFLSFRVVVVVLWVASPRPSPRAALVFVVSCRCSRSLGGRGQRVPRQQKGPFGGGVGAPARASVSLWKSVECVECGKVWNVEKCGMLWNALSCNHPRKIPSPSPAGPPPLSITGVFPPSPATDPPHNHHGRKCVLPASPASFCRFVSLCVSRVGRHSGRRRRPIPHPPPARRPKPAEPALFCRFVSL